MSYDHLTSEELLALAAHRAWLPKQIIRTIAEHPAATPDVWLELLDGGDVFEEYIVAELDEARASPCVRNRLRKSDHPRVLAQLCKNAGRTELVQLFPRLVELNPDVALALLESAPEVVERLTPDDLVPLLSRRETSVRERALPYVAQAANRSGPPD